jgi:hypothetical protein
MTGIFSISEILNPIIQSVIELAIGYNFCYFKASILEFTSETQFKEKKNILFSYIMGCICKEVKVASLKGHSYENVCEIIALNYSLDLS